MKCDKCGKEMCPMLHGQTNVIAIYVCFKCKLAKEPKKN